MPGFTQPQRDVIQLLKANDQKLALDLYYEICYQARYSDEPLEYCGITLQRGQWVRSLRHLQDDLANNGIAGNRKIRPGKPQIAAAISLLEQLCCIKIIKTPLGTLFTLLEPEENQAVKPAKKKRLGTGLGTNSGQTRDNTVRRREEGEKKDLQKDPLVNPEVHIAQKTPANTHTPGEVTLLGSEVDPTRTPKVRKNCTHFKCSDHEVELLKAWYIKKGLPIEMLPEVSVVIDDWLDGSTPAAKKARKSETHYRQARADWAIKKVKNILNMANGNNGHKTSNMDRLKAALAKAKAEEEQQKQQERTGGFVQ